MGRGLVKKNNAKFAACSEQGMTLLEVIFAIVLLLILVTTSSSMIRNGIDLRVSVSDQAIVNHQLTNAIQRISSDLQHSFILNRKRQNNFYVNRSTKALFQIVTRSDQSSLRFTSSNHKAIKEHSPESDLALFVYELKRDDDSEMTHLYRGESRILPQDLEEDIPLQKLATNIKSFKIIAWDGDRWVEDWNSDREEHRDLLPHMVRVEIEAYEVSKGSDVESLDLENLPTQLMHTIVYLPTSKGIKQKRKPSTTIKYY